MRLLASILAVACVAAVPATAAAEWQPPDLHATKGSLAAVLTANSAAAGNAEERYAQRRERWTYRNGDRQLPVRVAVRGADFRATVVLGDSEYAAGRSDGTRWRADANGVAHATLSDDQGDAVDRLPESIFPYERADWSLAGESTRFGAAWVIVDRPPGDKPHWFYVDKATGLIEHEITREGKRTILVAFTAFEVVAGARRPSRWHVSDGDASHDLDVTVDDVAPQAVTERDVAIPQTPRLFMPSAPAPNGVVALPATFEGARIFLNVGLGKHRTRFILDTGTASITLARRVAQSEPSGIVLEHATVPEMTVGSLALTDVSTLALPIGGIDGILGYDFFRGTVVHIDYAGRRVDVMTHQAAESVFTDSRNTVIAASFNEGIPLVHAAFGSASGDRFALDTGSSELLVLAPFAQRYAHEIDSRWTPSTFTGPGSARTELEGFLEGTILVAACKVSSFELGPATFRNFTVGVEVPNGRSDAIDIPLDGIIGTDQMSSFEWWFDYDGGRIAVRRNNR